MIINKIINRSCQQNLKKIPFQENLKKIPCREFSTALSKKIEYNKVPFIKEDLDAVYDEVPNIKYYYIGEEDPQEYPYLNTPMTDTILSEKDMMTPNEIDQNLKFSKLENGLRIASVDRGGLTSSLGLFVKAGSRFEHMGQLGVSHMSEMMAFKATGHLSELRQIKAFETLGADGSCTVNRENFVYQAECLREYVPYFVPILVGNILFPRFLPWEVKEVQFKIEKQQKKLEKNPEALVSELIHQAAWHNNTLGLKLYSTPACVPYFTPETIRQYFLDYFSCDRMVFVGVNVDHEELCKWLMRSFVDYNAIPPSQHDQIAPVYTGGEIRIEAPKVESLHLAFGYEIGGWNTKDCVTASVLQAIMGGGGAFSTGGPGKGLYSRIYLNVMSRYGFVESCYSFNTQYSDVGLFGLYMITHPEYAADCCHVAMTQLTQMGSVTAEELNRGKKSLINSVHMNLESKSIVMEDIGRQLMMSDKYLSADDLTSMINAVSPEDIKKMVASMLSKRLSFAAYGNTSHLPHYEEIVQMIKK
eukprot:GHVL01039075.1.p1 GENE.GHVL01039075.1~~GHVL01039075.1.p1  ORF type:complete len:530 (-),score=103.38 GHVL01039075.1:60-1649(-)